MRDEELSLVRAIVVRTECPGCHGAKFVPGGQREYGELVQCQLCKATGTVPDHITFDQLKKLLQLVV